MIDPIAAILSYLGSDADLTDLIGDQLAVKHKFGMDHAEEGPLRGWPVPSPALTLSPDPGEPIDLDAGTWRLRLEVCCYGARQEAAAQIYRRLIAIADAFVRTTTQTGAGLALIYWIAPDGSPRFERDPDIHIDLARGFFRLAVAKDPVAPTG